jgi:hypothetical protein
MFESSQKMPGSHQVKRKLMRLIPPLATVRSRLRLLRWLVPVSLVILVIAYEFGPARWVYNRLGFPYHLLAEILVFATIGPIVVFLLLDFLWRWLDERDTSDYQAQLLAQVREDANRSRQLTDDSLQALFSVGTLLSICKSDCPDLPPEKIADIEATEQALNAAIQHLRSHLQS